LGLMLLLFPLSCVRHGLLLLLFIDTIVMCRIDVYDCRLA
jgi:hypothetical protein